MSNRTCWGGGASVLGSRGSVTVYAAGHPLCLNPSRDAGRATAYATRPEEVSCAACRRVLARSESPVSRLVDAAERLAKRSTLLDPEPDPRPGAGDVWADVIASTGDARLRALYSERREQGIARYGTPLQRDNGRDHLVDAVQEATDLVVYLHAAGGAPSGIASRVEEILLDLLDLLDDREVSDG